MSNLVDLIHDDQAEAVMDYLDGTAPGAVERVLQIAARESSLSVMEALAENCSTNQLNDAFISAAFNDNTSMLPGLVEAGAEPGRAGTEDLRRVVTNASALTIRRLVDLGVDPDEHRLLRTALKHGHSETVHVLLEQGADPTNYTPSLLFEALSDRDEAVIAALCEAGADPRDPRGDQTLVQHIRTEEHPDALLAVFRALHERFVPFSPEDLRRIKRHYPDHHRYITERMRPRERRAFDHLE